MASSSISFTARFARVAIGAAAIAAIAVGARGERASACSGGDWGGIEDITTFDPSIVGDWDGLAYNPYSSSFGGSCGECLDKVMDADWVGWLGGGVLPADWHKVLATAHEDDLVALRAKATGKAAKAPKGYETSSIWKANAASGGNGRLLAALDFVKLARQVESYASFATSDPDGNSKTVVVPPTSVVAAARDGMKAKAADPFLAQRYAFQALRATFYTRDWPGVIALYDRNQAVFAGPSLDLSWRARHYLAGALMRKGAKARGNLELARIAAEYPPVAGLAALDFGPAEDTDWKAALSLATTVKDKTELWRMVGIKKDPLVATQEILKLDPKSPMVGLLLVRELTRAEGQVVDRFAWNKPEAKDVAAQRKTFAQIEQIAINQITRGGDRPWLMELIAGHIAAKRGDLTTARTRLTRAQAAQPNNPKVANQARASLAVALAMTWKLGDKSAESELATAMAGLDKSFGRQQATRDEVRDRLAKVFLSAGKTVDAEFLKPGTVDPPDYPWAKPKAKRRWEDSAFVKQMIARSKQTATPFDKFVVEGSYKPEDLEFELSMRLLIEGDFAGAQQHLAKNKVKRFGVDPFVIHKIDCHDCDQTKYAKSKWDHANLIAKLVELDAKVKAGGEAGAEAALQIGAVIYNLTWFGNARMATDESHQTARDATPAIVWFKKAFDLTKNREVKAKAAFLASKAELGTAIAIAELDPNYQGGRLPIPKTWFPVLKQFSNTKYYKEVIGECGHFAAWAAK